MVIKRNKEGFCPVCNERIKEDEPIAILSYNGTAVTVHRRHIMEVNDDVCRTN